MTTAIEQRYKKALKILSVHGQQQLLRFWNQLDCDRKQSLLSQIERLDFDRLDKNIKKYVLNNEPAVIPGSLNLAPAQAYPAEPKSSELIEKYKNARRLGAEIISAGKVAAFMVAGGQGTRLGFDGPKGDYPISPVKNKTLFQLFTEYLAAAGEKYGVKLRWYIMTSELNYEQTMKSLRKNNYFGLDAHNIFIFKQGTEPNFGMDGEILLSDKATIACSPDGHGGSLKALYHSGAIADMKKHGIEYISYHQVDNPLIKIIDPLFIGLHAMDGSQMSSKALIKAGPEEKVGNFCIAGGRIVVIEYSDLPTEYAHKRNPDGSLVFTLGSIAIHIISVDFVEKLNSGEFVLPLHRAIKKIPHIDSAGNKITPTEPDGIKLETFVFDALPLAEKSVILETLRDEEFAPVKNSTGVDSAGVTRRMMSKRAKKWLRQSGLDVCNCDDCIVEMAASFAICPEDVTAKIGKIPPIKSGKAVYLQ